MSFLGLLTEATKGMPLDTSRRDPGREIIKKLHDIEDKEVKITLEKANKILSQAQNKKDEILKTSQISSRKATSALEKSRKIKILLLEELEYEYKPIQQAFSKKEKSGYFKPIAYAKSSFANTDLTSSFNINDFEPVFDFIMKYTPHLKSIRANKYLKNAKSYSLEIDGKVAKINSEILSFKYIIKTEEEALLVLNTLEAKVSQIKPKIKIMLNKKKLSEKDKKTTLFLGQAMNILIDSLNCTVLNKSNLISGTYRSKLDEIKSITLKIEEIFI